MTLCSRKPILPGWDIFTSLRLTTAEQIQRLEIKLRASTNLRQIRSQ